MSRHRRRCYGGLGALITVALALALPIGSRPAAASSSEASFPASSSLACATTIAAHLRSTGRASQVITVEAPQASTTYATLTLFERTGGCWRVVAGPYPARIGTNGFSSHHREGDGTTPIDAYDIGSVMYGNAANPGVHYPYHRLVCGDWWDEDPTSATYNTFQHVACGATPSFGGDSEALWQETAAYPSFAVIDYNTDPVHAGAGSGIFLHADIGSPTAGCVSLPLADLDTVLRLLEPSAHPLIVMAPESLLQSF